MEMNPIRVNLTLNMSICLWDGAVHIECDTGPHEGTSLIVPIDALLEELLDLQYQGFERTELISQLSRIKEIVDTRALKA